MAGKAAKAATISRPTKNAAARRFAAERGARARGRAGAGRMADAVGRGENAAIGGIIHDRKSVLKNLA